MEAFVPAIEKASGRQVPVNYNVLVTTGRTSCYRVNLQQSVKAGGYRECFEARDPENNVLVAKDFDSFEMFGLAQSVYEMFGNSKMLDALNNRQDPHLMVVESLGIGSYEDLVAARYAGDARIVGWRQAAKVFNFGGAGGMAASTFISLLNTEARETLRELDPEAPLVDIVQLALDTWKDFWELGPLFRWASSKTRGGGYNTKYEQPITGRIRKGFTYCQLLNSTFQPRCADAAKGAIKAVMNEMPEQWGVYPFVFVHDEIGFEGPVDELAEWDVRAGQLMIEGATPFLPDCKLGVGTEVTGTTWSKSGVSVEQYLKSKEAA